jgi:hypothetical protein
MAGSNSLKFNKPDLFSPTVVRNVLGETNGVVNFEKSDFTSVSATALSNTASFKYDLPGDGIKSTQQLNIDWSNFENHTFFNSARVKVQVAFDKIINQFPFDGTQEEYELFFDGLTGYEKYVYDNMPKHKGYLFFSGTRAPETTGGTYIAVKDVAGADFPTLSRTETGVSVLNPQLKSMTIEFQICLPTTSSTDQIILQKISGSGVGKQYGFGIVVGATGSTSNTDLAAAFISGSTAQSITFNLTKGEFHHVVIVWDRTPGIEKLFAYCDNVLMTSSSVVTMTNLGFDSAPLYIGSGSTISVIGFTPTTTFSGALDELRIWHSVRTIDEMKEFKKKTVFADDDLKLYYKFNEPSGSNSNLVIDSSRNSLHGVLSTVAVNTFHVREIPTGSIAGSDPMTYEKLTISPILFPDHPQVSALRENLLSQASEFDQNNPNIITRLVPKHYLLEGQAQDGTDTEEGSITDSYDSNVTPRTNKLGDTQLLLSLLWTWAKFFDEMKLYTQAFGDLLHVEYDSDDTIPDHFLQFLANHYGFKLPPLFNGTTIPQFVDAENLDNEFGSGTYSLQYLQNQIWRRILINLRDISTSKGTLHSVKSFIRSVGIDPDNNFRIREFGGPTKRALSEAREAKSEISTMLNFVSGGVFYSSYLTGSKTEPGWPYDDPTKPNGMNYSPNGLFMSGNWTYEGSYKFETNTKYNHTTQSLVRFNAGNTALFPSGVNQVFSNLIAVSGSGLTLYIFSNIDATSRLEMQLTGVDVFDGNIWNISFGKFRNDYISSSVSSSWFLRAAKQRYGEITDLYTTATFYNEKKGSGCWFSYNDASIPSGSFFTIGSQSLNSGLWNTFTSVPESLYATDFQGKLGHVRFWSKGLELEEWHEHVRNFKSLGVANPLTNFNFVKNTSGSWEKLRMDLSTDQQVLTSSTAGAIRIFDFSQNNLHASGVLFPSSSTVIVPQRFFYSHISPKFDEASSNDKVRIRGFLNPTDIDNAENGLYVGAAPVYEIEKSESPTDNTRFTIDFSVVDALNQDIINIFSALDSLDNIIGNPELIFSMDYPKLEELRTVYFNRLTEKVNLKGFFEFFKWFDTNIGTFIAQLIPRKTKYLGTNFVIESHMLERPKMEYLYSDMYIGENHRHSLKDTILLQQFVSLIGRF